jgi:hypothetical protein
MLISDGYLATGKPSCAALRRRILRIAGGYQAPRGSRMTNHFLSDVCFGTLNTSLLTASICTVFLKAVSQPKGA